MRVPIPIVMLLAVSVVGGVWWKNTRHMDFMTPPTPEELVALRLKVESSLPRPEVAVDAISVPPPVREPIPVPPVPEPEPEMDLGDLTRPPTLQSYAEVSPEGAAKLIELARKLEEKGEFPRALLAWERVLDLTKPDEVQAAMAVSSIKRLRPTLPPWNADPAKAIEIVLHAGTGKKLATALKPVLEEVARDLETASSGTITVKSVVTAGKTNSSTRRPAPVALWLSGPEKNSPSTEVLSFTANSSELLRQEVMKTVFTLIRGHLGRQTAYTPPAELAEDGDAEDALQFRITRLCWREFATALTLPAKQPE